MDVTATARHAFRTSPPIDGAHGPRGESVTAGSTTTRVPSRRTRVQGMSTRRWLVTTPGRLRTASIAIVVASVLLAVVATVVTSRRVEAAQEVARQSGPELAAAQSLYGSLADADATASTIFLRA